MGVQQSPADGRCTVDHQEEARWCEAEVNIVTVEENVQDTGITFSSSMCSLGLFTAGTLQYCPCPCVIACACVHSSVCVTALGCNWVRFTWQTTSILTGDKHSPVAVATSCHSYHILTWYIFVCALVNVDTDQSCTVFFRTEANMYVKAHSYHW